MQEIQLIFNPGKGSVDLSRITAVVGDRVGAMPRPVRRGYVFTGWYMTPDGNPDSPDARRITPETVLDAAWLGNTPSDTVLYAGWRKPKGAGAGKKNAYKTQKRAIIITAAAVVLLAAAFIVAGIIADIYRFTDVDNQVYTIKKHDGEYALFKDGELCDMGTAVDSSITYYMTEFGTQLQIDPDTGEYTIYAIVDTEGTEQISLVGKTQHVLMFKKLTYDASSTQDTSKIIKTIEMHNQNGDFTLERGNNNRFTVKGHAAAVLVEESFAQLSSGCGYTLSSLRLENPLRVDGAIDYAEYGLAPEIRVEKDEQGQDVLDENGNPVTYEYKPTQYTITTMNGDSYTVTVGDAIISGEGYYARYADRETIYILPSTNLSVALQSIESLITPLMVYPMTLTTYMQVEDFTYYSDIDHTAITRDLYLEILGGVDILEIQPDENGNFSEEDLDLIEQWEEDYAAALDAMTDEEFNKIYYEIFLKHAKLITRFDYVDLAERETGMNASLPYKMDSEYMAGYLPNSDNIGTMLQKLYDMTFVEVTVLGPTADDLIEYGLDEYAHDFSFTYTDAEGTRFVNYFQVSEKTEDGLYYGYNPDFDMIVCFTESQAQYLEWEEIDWYEREYFQINIAFTQTIRLEGAGMEDIVFTLDNSKSDQTNGINSEKLEIYANGELMDYVLTYTKPGGSLEKESATYNFRRFYQSFLSASMEGNADLTEEEMAALRSTPDEDCLLKITVLADDGQGNTVYNVYRFYRYSERKAYMTIETLDAPDAPSDPTRASGHFYVLKSFCDKLIADANRFIEGTEIVVESKN